MHLNDILINVALLAFVAICFYTLTCGAYFLYYHDDRAVPAQVWAKIPQSVKAIGFLGSGVFVVCALIGFTVAANRDDSLSRPMDERTASPWSHADLADQRPRETRLC